MGMNWSSKQNTKLKGTMYHICDSKSNLANIKVPSYSTFTTQVQLFSLQLLVMRYYTTALVICLTAEHVL